MQKNNLHYSVSLMEQLFIEKGLELLYKDTIDTYRLRLHNPKTIVKELINICQAAKDGSLTNNIYAATTSNEVISLLRESIDGLQFNLINRKYYLDLIKNVKPDNYSRIIQASKLVLHDNNEYQNSLFVQIKDILDTQLALDTQKKQLILLIQYLCVELINLGYTKQYLYFFFRTIFVHIKDNQLTFEKRYETWRNLGDKQKEKFKVIYNILGDSFQYRDMEKIDSAYQQVNKKYRVKLPHSISERISKYLDDRKEGNLISIEVETLDHFKAIEVSRAKIASDLDLYHFGYNNRLFRIDNQAVVIGDVDPSKASTLPSNYQIDGYIRNSQDIFNRFLEKIGKLEENNVSKESIDKIVSAIRYLRTGSESPELETKLLNYWIGLEYIFTSFNDNEKTIDRICKYFPVCHALIYVKRNLYDFHKAIERIDLQGEITNYVSNLDYLTDYQTYNTVIQKSSNQLMVFRAEYYQKFVEDPGNIQRTLDKHLENLKWNLIRLYRIRNEIVHNAAVKNSIYANVSHIKYYLTFVLNSILDFMSSIPVDINNDGILTIEDYFIAQDIMLGSLKGKTLKDYLAVHNPLETLH